jgi:Flp pilus assembly protein TadG
MLGILLIGMLGLAIDLAYMVLAAQQTQNSADAAALGGASAIRMEFLNQASLATQAQMAQSYANATAYANYITNQHVVLDNGDVVVGHYYLNGTSTTKHGFYSGDTPYNAVQVTARRVAGSSNGPVALNFGPIFDVPTAEVLRMATAMTSISNAGVIVLNQTVPSALSFKGTGSNYKIVVTLPNGTLGDVIVNSNNASGVSYTGNPTMDISNFYIGSGQSNTIAMLPAGGNVYTYQPPSPDPLATLRTQIDPTGLPNGGVAPAASQPVLVNGTTVWTEGTHSAGLPKNAVLGPGLHWVDGGISGAFSSQSGAGVMVFVHSGDVSLGGNSGIAITTMTTTNAPASKFLKWAPLDIGLWIYQGNLTMKGTPDVNNNGVLYLTGTAAKNGGNIDMRGTPTSLGSMIITDTLSIEGTGEVNVKYNGAFPVPTRVFLVQ